jgi:superfamily II DNA or RNA helicase
MLRLSFDAGTLLLHGADPATPPSLPGLRWDPRIQCFRAPPFLYRSARAALRDLGVPFRDDVFVPAESRHAWRTPELRPYQHAALAAWRAAHDGGLVVMPTGSGKTRLACAALAGVAAPSLCLVPTRALLHQWRDELSQHFSGPVGCLGDGERRLEGVTVATFEAAYRQMAQIGNRVGVLVIDEVHHFGAGVRDEALEMCPAPRRLGLTATPPEAEQLARLAHLVGPLVCELRVADLAGEWLAAFEVVALRLALTSDERARYRAASATFRRVFDSVHALSGPRAWADFVALASRSEQGRAALAAFRFSRRLTAYCQAKRAMVGALLARHRQQRVLVFTSDNETAYAIAREHLVMPITCDIDRAERARALDAFKRGTLRALVSARVLNEGLDVPEAEVAIIVGGTSGEREHVQRVGRLLRPAPGKTALVYELIAEGTHEVRKAQERRRALAPARAS